MGICIFPPKYDRLLPHKNLMLRQTFLCGSSPSYDFLENTFQLYIPKWFKVTNSPYFYLHEHIFYDHESIYKEGRLGNLLCAEVVYRMISEKIQLQCKTYVHQLYVCSLLFFPLFENRVQNVYVFFAIAYTFCARF